MPKINLLNGNVCIFRIYGSAELSKSTKILSMLKPIFLSISKINLGEQFFLLTSILWVRTMSIQKMQQFSMFMSMLIFANNLYNFVSRS